jgi:Flp pilus assembly protein TadG
MTVKLMKPLAVSELSAALRSSAVRLVRDSRGIAAVEFAVIVPLMLVMFFGMIEFSSGVAVNRKVALVTQELADLVSRYKSVGDPDFTNFNNIGNAMMKPYDQTPLKATISELYIDPSTGAGRVQWSKGAVPRAIDSVVLPSTVVVPSDLVAKDPVTHAILPGQYLIFTEANYLYTPAVGYVMAKAGVTLSNQMFMRPRLTTCVIYPTPTGTPPPPLPPCPTL